MDKEVINYADGSRYEGAVWEGQRHGTGAWQRADGTRYVGQWKNDRPDGQGTLTWPEGKKYVGQWKSGKQHGQGAIIHPDGRMIEGEWQEGALVQEREEEQGRPLLDKKERRQKALPGEEKSETESKGPGFFASLFDISMREMITPKVIRIMYVVGMVLVVLGALGALVQAIFRVSTAGVGALRITIVAVPFAALLGIILLRIYLEIIVLLFNIYDQLKEIRGSLSR